MRRHLATGLPALLLALALLAAGPARAHDEPAGARSEIVKQRLADGSILLTDRPRADALTLRSWQFERSSEDDAAAAARRAQAERQARAVSERIARQLQLQAERDRDIEVARIQAQAEADREAARLRAQQEEEAPIVVWWHRPPFLHHRHPPHWQPPPAHRPPQVRPGPRLPPRPGFTPEPGPNKSPGWELGTPGWNGWARG